jgi:hypothetical protein
MLCLPEGHLSLSQADSNRKRQQGLTTTGVSDFDDQLVRRTPTPGSPSLMLTHITSHAVMLKVCRTGEFDSATDCPVYKERLLYTFYGRPAYRMPDRGVAYHDVIYAPTCFLVKPSRIGKAKRMLPFDSGGFDRYGPAMHHSWVKDDFEITTSESRVSTIVETFWGDDRSYFGAKAVPGLSFSPSLEKLTQYYRLLSNQLTQTFDSRCSSIEVQFPAPLLLEDSIEAIVVPDAALDKDLTDLVRRLGANLVTYEYDAPFYPSDFAKPIQWAVRDYYQGATLI